MKIIALGSLPKALGGKSTHGLATGIFDLINAINELQDDYKVVLCATDFTKAKTNIKSTTVIGAQKMILARHAASFPLRMIRYALLALVFKIRFDMGLKSTFARFLFYDYAAEAEKPSIISAHGPGRGILAMHLTGFGTKQVVLRIHGISGMDPNVKAFKSLRKQEKYVAKQHFAVVTHISNWDLYKWQKFYGKWRCPATVILNGFDNKVFAFKNYPLHWNDNMTSSKAVRNKIHLLTVASLFERKGQINVVRALGRMKSKTKFIYSCIGEGDKKYKKRLKREAESLHVDIRILGYMSQAQIAFYLNQVDYMIMPSSSEGFGKVFIESIACGTRVIIPKNLSLARERDVLDINNSIFLESNDVDNIYAVLVNLKNIRYDRKLISNSVAHLSWEKAAKEYIASFRELGNHSPISSM